MKQLVENIYKIDPIKEVPEKQRNKVKMVKSKKIINNEIEESIFNFDNLTPRRGSWQWWFWLLFLDNPKKVEKPRQIMVLWSTKQDKVIECNDKRLELDLDLAVKTKGNRRDGAVAAWYFDGNKMNHNYILEQTPIVFKKNEILTENPKTKTGKSKGKYYINLPEMEFNMKLKKGNEFLEPQLHKNTFFRNYSYDLIKMNKLELNGKIGKEKVKGSAYFQRIFLNAPAVPWYWGVFHFEDNSVLVYFMPHLGKFFGRKAVKKQIEFNRNGEYHCINDIKIKEQKGENPVFFVSGENEKEKISFEVHTYSSSYWKFRKKIQNIGPKTTFTYNEYPAVIKNFELVDKKSGKLVKQDELGSAVGNAEKSTGFII